MQRLIILFAVLMFWSISVSAEINFYVGAGATATFFQSGSSLGSDELDDTAIGGQIFAGSMFTRNFGTEIKYSDSGDADQTISGTKLKGSIDGFTIYGVATYPFPKRAEASFKLGYTFQDGEITGLPQSVSDDDDGFAAAGMLRIRIGDNWAISGELEYLSVDFNSAIDEPLRWGLNAEYHF
jgi:hypothetical protein